MHATKSLGKTAATFTGLAEIDKLTQLTGGNIGILVGETGCEKTTALLTMAMNNARAGRRSLVINTELYPGVMPRKAVQLCPDYPVDRVMFASLVNTNNLSPEGIDTVIQAWLGKKRGRRGRAVYIDGCNSWVSSSNALNAVMRDLQRIAVKHNVVIWVNLNTRKAASNNEALGIIDTGHSIHVHDVATLSLGLSGRVMTTATIAGGYYTLLSILKTKHTGGSRMTIPVFRDDNGRLWDSQLAWHMETKHE